jgi:hypothetical protein
MSAKVAAASTPQPGPIPDPEPPPVPTPEPPVPPPGPPSPPNPERPNPPPDPPGHEPQPDEPPMPRAALVYVVQIRDGEEASTERRLRFATEDEATAAFLGALSAGLWADVRVVHARVPPAQGERETESVAD